MKCVQAIILFAALGHAASFFQWQQHYVTRFIRLGAVDNQMPIKSPATLLPNQIHHWRGQRIRYQVAGPEHADHVLLLVHGLFVNSDHWRKTLTGLGNAGSYRLYALDLLGSGWSDKPSKQSLAAQILNGENGRFLNCQSVPYKQRPQPHQRPLLSPTMVNVPLGTPSGGHRLASQLDLRHPLNSPYNFYTWAEQITDFVNQVILANSTTAKPITLVANSIGTISTLQATLDQPSLFNGLFLINPNFRELHMAEVPFPTFTMPLLRTIQSLLRSPSIGHKLFQTLATPTIVRQILETPYSQIDALDEELVTVLLDPLLTPGAADVVFDTLSYSAGPLPEQLLSSNLFPRETCPVWVVYGREDPWTSAKRVERMPEVVGRPKDGYGVSTVERVVGLDGVGHCPHDESPELVNALIREFLDRLAVGNREER